MSVLPGKCAEGLRFAMEDMTEIRNLVIRRGAGAALKQMGE